MQFSKPPSPSPLWHAQVSSHLPPQNGCSCILASWEAAFDLNNYHFAYVCDRFGPPLYKSLVMTSYFRSAVLVLSFVGYSRSLVILPTLPTQPRAETAVSPWSPKPTTKPYLNPALLKRDEACGFLGDAYSNSQVPICAGTASLCTFSDHLQGCCDGQGNCDFYTSCIGYSTNAPNAGPSCLSCPSNKPYCTKFEFFQAGYGNYDAYSCGNSEPPGTLYGFPASGAAVNTNPPTTTASLTNSTDPALQASTGRTATSGPPSSNLKLSTALPPQTAFSTTIQSPSKTSASQSSSTDNTLTQSTQSPHNHLAAIVGGAAGALAVIAVISAIVWRHQWKNRRRLEEYRAVPVLQQGRRPPSSQYGGY
jgi:hypothetical protein